MSDTSKAIVQAARDLLAEKGLSGFSMRQVASKVGVTATALYRHYDSKEVLIGAVLDEGFRLFEQALLGALPGISPLDRLERTSLAYLEFALEHAEFYRLMFMSTAHDYGLRQVSLDAPGKLSRAFVFLVDRVREVRDETGMGGRDTLEVAAMLWSLWHGLVSLQLVGHYRPVLSNVAEFRAFFTGSTQSFLRGLRT